MISVIIPYYNHADAIDATLRSIALQQGVVIDVILVDDGSDTPIAATAFQDSIKSLRVIRHKENKGAPAARNTGLREAKGQYVIFWDADVVAVPDMLQQMKEVLDMQKHIDFVYSNFVFGPKTFRLRPFSVPALCERNYIHSTSLIRRSSAPLWDESLKKLQDWDYWLTVAEQRGRGYWIDRVLFAVGQRKEGMSRWIPSFAYRAPFRWLPFFREAVERYEAAEQIVRKKHTILS